MYTPAQMDDHNSAGHASPARVMRFLKLADSNTRRFGPQPQPHYAVYSKVAEEIGVTRERLGLTLMNP